MNVKIKNNPRKEAEKHYYKADHNTLKKLGFKRTRNMDEEIEIMLNHLIKFKKNISEKKQSIIQNIEW